MAGVNSSGRPGGVGNRGQTNRDKINDGSAGRTGGRSAGNEAVIGGKAVTVDTSGGKVTTTPTGSPTSTGPKRDSTGALATGPLGGGTTTVPDYVPGAVPNFPDANAAAVVDMLSSAIPGMGLTNTIHKGLKALDGADPLAASNFGPIGDALGADTGLQSGWQPNRDRGSPANPNDPRGTSEDERAIPGRSFGAGTTALTGDPEDSAVAPGPGGEFSDDVLLRDRRRPRVGAGTQMLLG